LTSALDERKISELGTLSLEGSMLLTLCRPVIGGHFALLALEKARRSSIKPDYAQTSQLVLAGGLWE
jgi:hypothetical protein